MLEHHFIGLRCPHALPPRIEPPSQLVAVLFRPLQALEEDVALAKTLFEFRAETSPAGQMPDEITNEPPEPGH